MWPADALEGWKDFYLLVGTAGATLLALLFVAVTLGVGYLTKERQVGTRIFMSPIIIHFASIFLLSAIAMVPHHHAPFYAVVIGAAAIFGAGVSSVITVRVFRSEMTTYWQDYFAYGLWPAVAYLALLTAAALIYRHIALGLDVFAGALLLLAIVNIRNAWDLTLTMARQHRADS